jgi:hypothetical protein
VLAAGGGSASGVVGQVGKTQLISRATGQNPVPPGLVDDSLSTAQSVSADGRYAVFASLWARVDSNHRPTDYESAALTN